MSKFVKGQSGNPDGRPKGATSHQKIRDAILNNAPQIIDSMIEKAKSGDTAAAKLLLDRVIAPMKAGDSFVQLPLQGDLANDARKVLQAMATMQLTPGQGQSMLNGISSVARITEIDELVKRVTALESGNTECNPLREKLNSLKS
jgi:hypothetical protein